MQKLSKLCTLRVIFRILKSEVSIKIKLKASFGGAFTGTYGDIVTLEDSAALNLIEKNLAELVQEEPELEKPILIPKILKGKKSGK